MAKYRYKIRMNFVVPHSAEVEVEADTAIDARYLAEDAVFSGKSAGITRHWSRRCPTTFDVIGCEKIVPVQAEPAPEPEPEVVTPLRALS